MKSGGHSPPSPLPPPIRPVKPKRQGRSFSDVVARRGYNLYTFFLQVERRSKSLTKKKKNVGFIRKIFNGLRRRG